MFVILSSCVNKYPVSQLVSQCQSLLCRPRQEILLGLRPDLLRKAYLRIVKPITKTNKNFCPYWHDKKSETFRPIIEIILCLSTTKKNGGREKSWKGFRMTILKQERNLKGNRSVQCLPMGLLCIFPHLTFLSHEKSINFPLRSFFDVPKLNMVLKEHCLEYRKNNGICYLFHVTSRIRIFCPFIHSCLIHLLDPKMFDLNQYSLNADKYVWPSSNMPIYKVKSHFWPWSKILIYIQNILNKIKSFLNKQMD